MEKENSSHESFGQIKFNRVNSNGTKFYGSELGQNNYITMTVHHSEIYRDLTQDRYFPTGEIVKIRMSSGQFAELITSMNCGTGIPCTIERIQGKKTVDLSKQESRKEFVHRKFEDRMKRFADLIRKNQKEAKEIVTKRNLSKQDIFDLTLKLNWLTEEIEKIFHFSLNVFKKLWMKLYLKQKQKLKMQYYIK